MLNQIVKADSVFLSEGKSILIEEFGKDYGIYFSIWWDRKGENEIDIVAENELDNEAVFYEVKRKAENIDRDILIGKAQTFLKSTGKFKNYELSYKALSMQDM